MMTTLKAGNGKGTSELRILTACRALDSFSTVSLTSAKLSSTLVIGGNRNDLIVYISMFYMYFTPASAITYAVEESDVDNVYLYCTSVGAMMG